MPLAKEVAISNTVAAEAILTLLNLSSLVRLRVRDLGQGRVIAVCSGLQMGPVGSYQHPEHDRAVPWAADVLPEAQEQLLM